MIPTALQDNQISNATEPYNLKNYMIPFGIEHYTVLHTRDRHVADEAKFVEPLRHASAMWITGGSGAMLANTYLDTRVQAELKALLNRGGVIGADSGGSNLVGSLLLRGAGGIAPVVAPGHDRAFGLLPNTAIDTHVVERHIEDELGPEIAARPEVLGIGIDASTAIVVKRGKFSVIGKSVVLITDGKRHGEKPYYTLHPGDTFDLTSRQAKTLSN